MKLRASLPGLAAGLLSASLLAGAVPARAADETREAWRLFVTDQAEGKVTVIDAASGKVLNVFPTSGYVTHLTPSETGELLVAVQMDHDRVQVIGSGIRLSDHGDHGDIAIGDAVLLPAEIKGGRPVHTVMHGDEILQFFDLEGAARVYSEDALLAGNVSFETVKASAPHHGVVVPMGEAFLVSEPDLAAEAKPDTLPPRLGLRVIGAGGEPIGEVATCTGLHGEASSAGTVAFGCDEGVLLAEPQAGASPRLTLLPYGKEMPEGRVGTLLGGKAMRFFLGNYGEDRVVIIDPSAETPYQLVDLPVRRVDFALDPVRSTTAYIFTEDGRLHALDILTGKLTRSAPVTGAYSKDGHWRDPRPRLAVMGNVIAVTDPHAQLVRLLDAESFEELRTIPVKGLPFNIVAVGGSGLQH